MNKILMSCIKFFWLLLIFIVLVGIVPVASAALFLTADADLRYSDGKAEVNALGLNLRRTFADERGDRIILFTTMDAMHNFEAWMIDQAYVQYKGPLGRWNLTLGRYLLPFGLLPNYSTKRLLVKTLEYETIGLRSDNGLKLSGMVGDFDYALSLSQGVGIRRWTDIDNDWLITARVGRPGVDFEELRIGLSALYGRITPDKIHGHGGPPKDKQLLALDLIRYYGPLVWRAELILGKENDKRLHGTFFGADYALFPRTDLNLGYTYFDRDGGRKEALTVGLTYNIAGGQIRVAQKFGLGGDYEDKFSFQVYKFFTHIF
jgi:hypothetical protein